MPDDRDAAQDGPPRSPQSAAELSPDESLTRRVQRLEAALARLTNANPRRPDPPPLFINESAAPLPDPLEPEPLVIQRATPIPSVPTASLADFTLPPVALPPPVPDSSIRAVMRPLRTSLPFATQALHRVLPPSSILRDLWWDLRTGYRMLRDPTYPMTLACKFVPLFALFYVCIWPWFSTWTGLIGTVLSGLVNVVVLYLAYKVLQRELRRYYDFSQRYK